MTTLRINPLTRVEGHGEIELVLRDGMLKEVRSVITESPRLFESLLAGRSLFEVPALICRICAICSSVHRIAACQALERALGVRIPPAAERIRELLLLGGHMESHALHLFCLVLPDLEGGQSILELLRAGSPRARDGLEFKRFSNNIQELTGGRVIHPVNIDVGGVHRFPDRSKMEHLLEDSARWQERLEDLLPPFFEADLFPPSSRAVGTRIAVRHPHRFSLTGSELALSGGRLVPGASCRDLLGETEVPYSNAKQSLDGKTPFLTGALARLELAEARGEAPDGVDRIGGGIHANNAAQAIEMVWALQRSRELMEELLAMEENPPLATTVRPAPGVGTAVIEAPRGLLVHHYVIDDLGRIAAADVVTPTAINQSAIEQQILDDLKGREKLGTLTDEAERIVRSFDPCISCSVHLLEL